MPARSVNDRLLSHTVKHSIGVQRIAAGAVDQTLDQLKSGDKEIVDAIRGHSSPNGLIKAPEGLLASVRSINARTYRGIGAQLSSQLNDLAKYEVDHGSDLFDTVLPFDYKIVSPKRKFLRAIIDEEPMVGGLLNEWVEGMAVGRYNRVRTAIRLGVAANENVDQIVTRVRGRRTYQYRDGALAISRRSAANIVSTLHNHVANQARVTLYKYNANLVKRVVWISILDDKTCEECYSLDGEVWPVGQSLIAPLHLNCRCQAVAVIGDWSDYIDNSNILTMPQKAALDGKPPQRIDYNQWLSDQDEETQNDILGPERAAMFRRGFSVKKFVDHTGRRYTIPELKHIESKKLMSKSRKPSPVSTSVKRRNYGWQPDLPDQRDLLFAIEEPTEIALPVRLSLRDKMPPVFSQGSLGSCTANAIVAAVMYARGPSTPMLSRLDLYYKERILEDTVDEDSGAEIRDGIKAAAKWGICTEATWPYKIRSYKNSPPEAASEEDDQYRIKSYSRLKGHEDFMKALTLGYPFVGGFSVYTNFDDPVLEKTGILTMPTVDQKMVGGHAVLFVGYDSNFHSNPVFLKSGLQTSQTPDLMYECRNSFGDTWGDAGHFWMPAPYAENRDLSDDFWVVRA